MKYLIKKIEELKDVLYTTNNQDQIKYFNSFLDAPIAITIQGAWFANVNRLRCYNASLNQSTHYLLPVASQNEYPDLIQSKIKDSSGNIWLGTTDGLLRFNLAEKKWTTYRNKLNDSSSISSNLIFSLCLDPLQPKKYLWVCTGGNGLNRMDMQTGKCISYLMKDGLSNSVIYDILHDNNGNLWMSTNKGLS